MNNRGTSPQAFFAVADVLKCCSDTKPPRVQPDGPDAAGIGPSRQAQWSAGESAKQFGVLIRNRNEGDILPCHGQLAT